MVEETVLAARAALKEPLMDAIDVFTQQVSAAFNIDDTLHIQWRHGEQTFQIARLDKNISHYWPKITLLHSELLDDAQNAVVQTRLEVWLREQLDKTLGPVLALENAELKESAKKIAIQLYEQSGVISRASAKDIIATLEKEDRQALGKLGVRIGAFYIHQRDMLKPTALRMKSFLWRLAHDSRDTVFTLPQDGNVSMAAPENASQAFYTAMGLPILGTICVRIDMIERVNSAIFDGAVAGKYRFDPALASTIGVSVDTLHALLNELGFTFQDTTTGEGEEAKTVRDYFLKKRVTKPEVKHERHEKKNDTKKSFKKSDDKKKPAKIDKPQAAAPKVISGYNAFAGLAALRSKE